MSNSTLKARSSFPTETRRRFMHEPFGDLPRQRVAIMRPDQFKHHVEGADAARGREPVPVDEKMRRTS
jgi:hypothetical protein